MRFVLPLLVTLLMTAPALAQSLGQNDRQLEFKIANEFALEVGDYVLPPGDYVIYQFTETDRNLFALYEGETRSGDPVAMIDAWQVWHAAPMPGTKVTLKTTKPLGSQVTKTPVLEGWTIGQNEWHIRDIVARDQSFFQLPSTM